MISAAYADESSVTLKVPPQASLGDVIPVTVHVTHEGNNFFHFTDWVYLKANGQEIDRWEFTADNRPESENFTRQFQYTVTGPVTFTAQANCNIHGSTGPQQASVTVTPEADPVKPPTAQSTTTARPQPATYGFNPVKFGLLATGIVNFILLAFQVATGRRWIRVKIKVHRRAGQTLLFCALIHGILALAVSL